MDAWYKATQAAKAIKVKLNTAIAESAPYKLGEIVAVIEPGLLNVENNHRDSKIIHKGKVSLTYLDSDSNEIEYEVAPALFRGGFNTEKPIFVKSKGWYKIEPWNRHYRYLVDKVVKDRG